VCGPWVDLAVLAQSAELGRSVLLRSVDDLVHRGLVRDEGDGRFGIAHDQVRQVVYDQIDRDRRRELHRAVAQTLAQVQPDDVEAIGYHYWEGDTPDLAASHLLEAGLRAVGVNAYGTAAHHLQTARLATAQAEWPMAERYRLLGHLEEVVGVLGQRERQREVLEEMASLIGSSHELEGDLARRRVWFLAHTAEFSEAEEAAIRSVEAERRRGDGSGLAASLVALGTCVRWAGRPLEAVSHLEEAVAVSEDDQQRADALTELASTLVEVQRPTDAMPHLDQALDLYELVGDLRGQAEVAGIQGRAFHQTDAGKARTSFERAIEICRQIGYRHGEGVNLVNLSLLERMLGGVAAALVGYDQAAQIFAELGNRRGEAMVLANSAWARQAVLGEYERAEADATKAMRHFIEIGDRGREAQCLEILAGIALGEGRLSEGIRLLEESLDKLSGTGQLFLEAQHLRSLAQAQVRMDDHEAARATLDRAERLCVEADLPDIAVELKSIRALVHLVRGELPAAVAAARRAVAEVTPGVDRPYLVHHRHALAAQAAGQVAEARQAALRAEELLESALEGLSPEAYRTAIDRVPEHRAVLDAAVRFAPSTVQAMVPAVEAPIGRPLDDCDLRPVTWTVIHPEDEMIGSPVERRRRRVLRLLGEAEQAGASPSIDQLAEVLGVSGSTVRRDLDALRRSGHRVITRGRRRVS
ncbi:MAG: DUF1670 domain-containing protein, partial [Actinobacteria bacterium]|nr:DUF1670 domain-containing protein [Actinomycetota bacterium]